MDDDTTERRVPLHLRIVFLCIPYLFIALLIGGTEAAVRLFLPHIPPLDVLIDSPSLRDDLSGNKDSPLLEPDPLLFWRLRPNLHEVYWDFTVVSTNAQGLRREGDIGRKIPGGFRIVCLGDSVTFGFRVPLAFPDHPHDFGHALFPYPTLVEKKLREANPGKSIEVVPLAVPAYTTLQGLNCLKREIDWLKPDVVTACFGWNDVCLRPVPDRESMPTDFAHVAARTLLVHSQAVTHFAKWRARERERAEGNRGSEGSVARISRDDYVANLLEICELSRAHSARAVVIGQVYRDAQAIPAQAKLVREYRDTLREAAAAKGVSYLQVDELIETNYPANDRLFGELIHPNADGHQVMARELL